MVRSAAHHGRWAAAAVVLGGWAPGSAARVGRWPASSFLNSANQGTAARSAFPEVLSILAVAQEGRLPRSFAVSGPGAEPAALVTRAAAGRVAQQSASLGASLPMSTFIESMSATSERVQGNVASDPPTPQAFTTAAEKLAHEFQDAVVRIHMIEDVFDFFRPFEAGQEQAAIGSGFAVRLEADGIKVPENAEEDPIFITNAHVVRNAHTVEIQLPAIGQAAFAAYVPLIYEDFDLALVRLKEPKKFLDFLASRKTTLKILPILKDVPVAMGMEVAALGFPLGSASLKLSRGVIAGTEEVDGRLCFQSTSPISPGSSGGPLFAFDPAVGGGREPQVIGVNFAVSANAQAQNANYVVPAVHMRQILHEFHRLGQGGTAPVEGYPRMGRLPPGVLKVSSPKEQGSKEGAIEPHGQPEAPEQTSGGTQHAHRALRYAPIDAIGVEANDALYSTSRGCQEGVFISQVGARSVLAGLPAPCFLVAVNGVALDSFGMGRTDGFLGNPLPFDSLMGLSERVEDPITLTVCKNGTKSSHVVSMQWNDSYEGGLKAITEPFFHDEARRFESFAGITVMEMTVNHISTLLRAGGSLALAAYLLPDRADERRLMVVHVRSGTYASHVVGQGMVLKTVNGKPVHTLADYVAAFEPTDGSGVWGLETERGTIFEIKFLDALKEQLMLMRTGQYAYLKTEAIMRFLQKVQQMHSQAQGQVQGPQSGNATIKQLSEGLAKLTQAVANMMVIAYHTGQQLGAASGGQGGVVNSSAAQIGAHANGTVTDDTSSKSHAGKGAEQAPRTGRRLIHVAGRSPRATAY